MSYTPLLAVKYDDSHENIFTLLGYIVGISFIMALIIFVTWIYFCEDKEKDE